MLFPWGIIEIIIINAGGPRATCLLSAEHVRVVSVDQRHTFLPVRIRFHIARHIGVEDDVLRVSVVVLRPHRLGAVERECFPPRVRILVVDEADPVAVHEVGKIAVALRLVLEWWSLLR
jgi:hypothetical protein